MFARVKVAALALVAGCALAASAYAEPSAWRCDDTHLVDFLHIEANEGGSSGGHVALRLGETVYHWQNEDGGLLRLSRREAADFLYEYSVLENRTLHVSRIAVSEEGFTELRDAFQRRWLDESVAVDGLAELRDDRAVLERMLAARTTGAGDAMPSVKVAGAGFFASQEGSDPDPAIARLRDRIERERGATFLATRAATLRRELAAGLPAWSLGANDASAPAGEQDWIPTSGLAREIEDRVAGTFAMDVLVDARAPDPEALRVPPAGSLDGGSLDESERVALAAWSEQLEANLVRLAASDRPGWVSSLLVGLARLSALHRSLAENRLVVVDAYPDLPSRVAGSRLERHRPLLPEVLEEAREALRDAREHFTSAAPSERGWADVETAANRVRELERVVAGGDVLRLASAPMRPSRSAELSFSTSGVRGATLRHGLAEAVRREAKWSARVDRQFGYQLLTRNCATEIFRLSGGALGDPITLEGSLDFIPFLSARAVREHWRVVHEFEIPSLRRRRAESSAENGDVWGALREASPLTSSLRRAARRDSIFLLFTDDLPWVRPAIGTANLATGVGAAAVGLALAPFDDADTLVAGLRGILFSLPELAFVNIRKGAFEWVPPADRPAHDALDPSPRATLCDAPLEDVRDASGATAGEEAVDDETAAAIPIAPTG